MAIPKSKQNDLKLIHCKHFQSNNVLINFFSYNLNPKIRALQSQPTVCPTLIHHIQRKHVNIKPNIKVVNFFSLKTKTILNKIINCITRIFQAQL